jgi:hypothetical protein
VKPSTSSSQGATTANTSPTHRGFNQRGDRPPAVAGAVAGTKPVGATVTIVVPDVDEVDGIHDGCVLAILKNTTTAEIASTANPSEADPQIIPASAIPLPSASPRLARRRAMTPRTTATIAAGIARNQAHASSGIEEIPHTMLAIARPFGDRPGEAYERYEGSGGGSSVMVRPRLTILLLSENQWDNAAGLKGVSSIGRLRRRWGCRGLAAPGITPAGEAVNPRSCSCEMRYPLDFQKSQNIAGRGLRCQTRRDDCRCIG